MTDVRLSLSFILHREPVSFPCHLPPLSQDHRFESVSPVDQQSVTQSTPSLSSPSTISETSSSDHGSPRSDYFPPSPQFAYWTKDDSTDKERPQCPYFDPETGLQCQKTFTRPYDVARHLKVHQTTSVLHACPSCGKGYTRHDALLRHQRSKHAVKRPMQVQVGHVWSRQLPAPYPTL